MKTMEQVRLAQRATPAGQLLWSMGMDYYDTDSCARRVAEHAAEKLAAKSAELADHVVILAATQNKLEDVSAELEQAKGECERLKDSMSWSEAKAHEDAANLRVELTTLRQHAEALAGALKEASTALQHMPPDEPQDGTLQDRREYNAKWGDWNRRQCAAVVRVRNTLAAYRSTSGVEQPRVVATHLDSEGNLITIGASAKCDDETVEVISFQPEGVEVKFFSQYGDRRCHTEVRDGKELTLLKSAAPATPAKVQRITPECQPVFDPASRRCWLWDSHPRGYGEPIRPRWDRVTKSVYDAASPASMKAEWTHWHPDQPTPPAPITEEKA